jgi:hypothetical protein
MTGETDQGCSYHRCGSNSDVAIGVSGQLGQNVRGGAFGNDLAWSDAAIDGAIRQVRHRGLDVRIVRYGPVPTELKAFAASFGD